jgi:hypothetical protein
MIGCLNINSILNRVLVCLGVVAIAVGTVPTASPKSAMEYTRNTAPDCLSTYALPEFCLPDIPKRDSMKAFLSHCRWESNIAPYVRYGFLGDISPNGVAMTGSNPYDTFGEDVVNYDKGAYSTHHCADGGLSAIRIGPFNTTGGYKWTEMTMSIAEDAQLFPLAGGTLNAFDVYVLGSIDVNGHLLGVPPIHQHHFHLWGSLDHPTDVINVHGEQQCNTMEGDVDCYIKTLPDGFAFTFQNAPVQLAMAFNDVRSSSSRNLTSWVVAGVRQVPPGEPFRKVSMLRVELRPRPWESRQSYNISVTTDSVTWDHGSIYDFQGYQLGPGEEGPAPRIPKGAMLIESSMHAHDNLLWDLLLFQGMPDQVFANVSSAQGSLRKTEYGTYTIDRTMRNIRERMLLPRRAPLACSFRNALSYDVLGLQKIARLPRCFLNPDQSHWVLIALHHNFGDYHTGEFRGTSTKYMAWKSTARMHAYVRVVYAFP